MLTIRKANIFDVAILLDWRNDETTRANSINSKRVNYQDHIVWLNEILDNPDSIVYIAEDGKEQVGTVCVEFHEFSSILSWTVAPEHRGKGLGKKLVKQIADGLAGKLVALIKPENIASQSIAKHAGLKFIEVRDGLMFYFRGEK